MNDKKNVFLVILGALIAAIVAIFVGKPRNKMVVHKPVKVNIPANVREVATASNLNELVAEFTE